ncbi:MAG TPA: hypothetical protein VI457_11855 [Methylococcaceae bacterium]|nr:hypothetical protein [Methylococcaceae bacterium]
MWDFQLLAAMRSIESAMPLVLHRVLACLAIAFGYLLATLAGAGTSFAVGAMLGDAPNAFGSVGAVGGFVLFAWVLYKARGILLHGVWAGHLAVLAAVRAGEKAPTGWKLVDYARGLVKSRFPSAGELADLDSGIRGVLRCYPARLLDLQARLPWRHPWLTRALERIVGEMAALGGRLALTEALSPAAGNPWRVARDTLGRCAASWPMLFKNIAWLHLFTNLGWLLAYLVIRAPFADIAALLPVDVPVWTEIFALVFSWALKVAFFEIIAAAALLQLHSSLSPSRSGWQSRLGDCPALADLERRAKEKRASADG